ANSTPVSIIGPAASLTVSGNNASRIFNDQTAPAGTAIAITGLTLTGGVNPVGSGGAITGALEQLSLTNCVLTANSADFGGAVAVVGGGTLTATDCVFSNNTAVGNIGAIEVFGGAGSKTALVRTTVSGNIAGEAGGLYATGYLLVQDSTISGN